MESQKGRLTIAQANDIDIVDYLSMLGIGPAKIRGDNYWYLSPLRDEKTPSFKVSRRLNKWYDHGTGIGGGLLSFALKFHHCTIDQFLDREHLSPTGSRASQSLDSSPVSPKILILAQSKITSPSLIKYAASRRIPASILLENCLQVSYQIADKKYFAIGFENDLGGFELRNSFSKASSSPKGTSLRPNNKTELAVFEGFFDFLSYLVIQQPHQDLPDFLILNSTAFFEKSLPVMLGYQSVRLFLDHDSTGQNCRHLAQDLDKGQTQKRFIDESTFYKNYKDLNLWLTETRRLDPQPKPP